MGNETTMSHQALQPELNNQNITREEPKSLVASSSFSVSGQGSNQISMSQTGQTKECTSPIWYYMYMLEKEFPRFLDIFTGKKSLTIQGKDNKKEYHTFNFKVFAYTDAAHRKRFANYSYTEKEYEKLEESVQNAKEAFRSDNPEAFNTLINNNKNIGNGYLFICGEIDEIQLALRHIFPRKYLFNNDDTNKPEEIPNQQMQEFIYMYESMPYNIELMQLNIEQYNTIKQKTIRITAGIFAGKKGKLMRIHKSHKLVFKFGNMTIALSHIHAFPYEVIE